MKTPIDPQRFGFETWTLLGFLFCLSACAPLAPRDPLVAAPKITPEESPTDPTPAESPTRAELPKEDPLTHEYWGAVVTIGDKAPWSSLEESNEVLANIGTLRTTSPDLAEAPLTTWEKKRTIKLKETSLVGAEFSPRGNGVLTFGTKTGTLYFYDVATGRLLEQRKVPDYTANEPISYVFVTEVEEPDRVIFTRPSGASLLFKDPAKDRKMGRAAAGSEVAHSKRFGLYGVDDLGQEGGKTIYFQWLTGQLAATVTCTKKTSDWSLSEDGKILALLHPQEEMVEILDIEQRRTLGEFKAPKNSERIAMAPGGELLAVGGDELILFNLTLGKVVAHLHDFKAAITRVRFAGQQDLLLVGTKDGQVLSYKVDSLLKADPALTEAQVLSHGAKVSIEHVQLSGNGRSLVTVGSDSTLRVWAR